MSYKQLLEVVDFGAPVGLTVWRDNFIASGGFNDIYYPCQDRFWYAYFSKRFTTYRIFEPLACYRTAVSESNNASTKCGFRVRRFNFLYIYYREILKMSEPVASCIAGTYLYFRKQRDDRKGIDVGLELSDVGLDPEVMNKGSRVFLMRLIRPCISVHRVYLKCKFGLYKLFNRVSITKL